MSKRAVKNWKKLRVLIVLLKLCGNKLILERTKQADEESDFEPVIRWNERLSYYIIDPKNFYRAAWTIMIGFIYSICYLVDPLLISFRLELL